MNEVLSVQLDYPLAALGCASLLALLCIHLRRVGTRKRAIARLWALHLVLIVLGAFPIRWAELHAQEDVQSTMESFNQAYAAALVGMGHEHITDRTPPNDPRYQAIDATMRRWNQAHHRQASAYTMRLRPDGKVEFIMSPAADLNGDGKIVGDEDRMPVGTIFDDVDPYMMEAFRGRRSFTPRPFHDDWGDWISAYEPLYDSHGRQEAIIGIDLPAKVWYEALREGHAHSIPGIVFFIVVVTALTTHTLLLRVNLRQRQQRELETAKQATLMDAKNAQLQQAHAQSVASNLELKEKEALLAQALAAAQRSSELHAAAARRFEELFHGLPVACFTFDNHGAIYEWNRAAEQLFELKAHEVLCRNGADLLPDCEEAAELQEHAKAALQGEVTEPFVWRPHLRSGTVKSVMSSTFPLHGPLGDIVAVVSAHTDISELKEHERSLQASREQVKEQLRLLGEAYDALNHQQVALREANSRLKELSETDALTGLKNHRALAVHTKEEAIRAAADGKATSAIMVDVDHFKSFNDSFGHPEGDNVLAQVAELLKSNSRPTDYVGRYGGEEFVVVLPNTKAREATAVAERLRRAIDEHQWPLRRVTASFGVSTLPASRISSDELIAQADRALYASKKAGRNCVTHFSKRLQQIA